MRNKLKIGLFGIALESVNFGVTALAFTQIRMLQRVEIECDVDFEYWVFSDDSQEEVDRIKRVLNVENLKIKYIVRIKTGLSGLHKLSRDIKECDLVIDLTYGDSFSDIYGLKHFYLYSLPKLVALWNKKCLIIAPQTIGPFYKKRVEYVAARILKKADYVVARDEMSFEYAEKLTQRNDLLLTSDLAINLPFEDQPNHYIVNGRLNIGLNVSLLMWYKDASNSKLNIQLSYKDLIYTLLDSLRSKGIIVHLIVHVYDKKEYTEYSLAEELHKKYDNTVLAPKFLDPIDAKNYMTKLDAFIGSRMHATIGAFSSGVPVIPISYSRKFEGLYGTLGYNYCIDCSNETVDSAVKKILHNIDELQELEYYRNLAFAKAEKMNEAYYQLLKVKIQNI